MKAKIVGVSEIIQGVSKKNGREYHGQSVYLTFPQKGVAGVVAMKQYLDYMGLSQLPKLTVGTDLYLDYDQGGQLLSFEVIPPVK